ncbi:hypothetical protein QE152_g29282 [Popillia japonica]|uniref:Uncharacterized protein n=1 Tax=Popillia japonica TaxID=7064 RepID=A0AAW1JI22_POPJA
MYVYDEHNTRRINDENIAPRSPSSSIVRLEKKRNANGESRAAGRGCLPLDNEIIGPEMKLSASWENQGESAIVTPHVRLTSSNVCLSFVGESRRISSA